MSPNVLYSPGIGAGHFGRGRTGASSQFRRVRRSGGRWRSDHLRSRDYCRRCGSWDQCRRHHPLRAGSIDRSPIAKCQNPLYRLCSRLPVFRGSRCGYSSISWRRNCGGVYALKSRNSDQTSLEYFIHRGHGAVG